MGDFWSLFGTFHLPSARLVATPFPHRDFSASWNPKGLRGAQISQGTMEFLGSRSRLGREVPDPHRDGAGGGEEPAPGGFALGFEVGMALFGFTSPFPSLWGSRRPGWERVPAESLGKAAAPLPELPFASFLVFPSFFCVLSRNHEVLGPVLLDGEEFWVDSSRFPSIWSGNHMEGREQRHSSDWAGGVCP